MQFSGKNLQNNPDLGVGATPLEKSWIRHWLFGIFYFHVDSDPIYTFIYIGSSIRRFKTPLPYCIVTFKNEIKIC